ncbi:uncharacterized protein LOC128953297 [Oppia nitens]|uniref:uncharacterized protein LOC128953297 n=1 Tax=Oppia nitens TaxID=1686743 RepID=UPI0023DA2390|nr:uncharacterized protein LOC128953297 [Oppia nitens]
MKFTISIIAIVLIIINVLVGGCKINDPWPKTPKFNSQYKQWSDKQLTDQLDRLLNRKCQLYSQYSNRLKKILKGFDWLAQRPVANCQYDRDSNTWIIQAISDLPENDKHRYLVDQTKWTDYWQQYYTDVNKRQSDCSVKMVETILNTRKLRVNDLEKFLNKNRKQVLAGMQKWLDKDAKQMDQKLWQFIDKKTLDDTKQKFSMDDKKIAEITDQTVKVGTLNILIIETEFFIRGYKSLNALVSNN